MTNSGLIDPRNHPNILNFTRFLLIIFLIFFIPTWLFLFNIIPLPFIELFDQNIQAFQFFQLFVVFPMVLIIIYFFFIRKKLLSWSELGFNKGKQGLSITMTYGLIGGIIDGAFDL
jgi:NADH:ubiquinone oxidoreductase subunit 3 (subunit A)